MNERQQSQLAGRFPVSEIRSCCDEAGALMLQLRRDGFSVDYKTDGSPVTSADLAAARLLEPFLQQLDRSIAVLCEEGEKQPVGERFWLLDPLDGTREFIAGRDSFTINIALVENSVVVAGLVYQPVTGRCWWGGKADGSCSDQGRLQLTAEAAERLLVSPREPLEQVAEWQSRLVGRWHHVKPQKVAGALKYCRIAEQEAIATARTAPCSAWDVAAGHAIIEGAGGVVCRLDGAELTYEAGDQQEWRVPGCLAGTDLAVKALLGGAAPEQAALLS